MMFTRIACVCLAVAAAQAQITEERLRRADAEPHNWLTYHGTHKSNHHSALDRINTSNVSSLNLEWVWQGRSQEKFETTPLVVDGIMYFTEAPNRVHAVDARTGREFWSYELPIPEVTYACCGKVNRGLAILGRTLFVGTLDMKLVALDSVTGRKKWETVVGEYQKGYALTMAPLAVKNMIILGPAGGELGIRGFIAAYDAETGKRLWRFNTIPEPGEPGNDTWGGDSWKYGGGSLWLTGSYDPELNLTYWGVGNPGPDWNPDMRPGDNLYASSVVALDADTGKLRWHFQFTPHDGWDWDSVQTPVLVDREWRGRQRKLMLWGNRNGFYYVLDRATGEFLLGKPFVKQTWAKGLDDKGRPMLNPNVEPTEQGNKVWPGVQGGTNWFAPSYSPKTGLFYLTAWDDYYGIYFKWKEEYQQGRWFAGGAVQAPVAPTRREALIRRGRDAGYAAIRALDPSTGNKVWEYEWADMSESGLLTTAGNVLFSGSREGHFVALDAANGKLLWRTYLGASAMASPITYMVGGKQYVSIACGRGLFTFSLRDKQP